MPACTCCNISAERSGDRAILPREAATACTHLSGGIPPPPCGEDRLGRRPSEGGVAGHGPLGRSRPRDISRRGKRQAIRQASVPAADTAECFVDKALHARRPPPRSAFGRVGPPPQ